MFTVLTARTEVFASYHALEHLKIDITEGVWDWTGGGSPSMGASSDFQFPRLGFPSVKHFELVVCDRTLGNPRTGPLNLVHSKLFTELSIDVRYSVWWCTTGVVHLFESLSPLDLPALARWEHKGRTYHGLTNLWVDEQVLISPNICTVEALLDSKSEESANVLWRETLQAAFGQLESLRVGFGAITHIEANLILGLCDPTKLTQFGFEWNWWHYGADESISAELLACLSLFPKLTDVHFLFPRPGTQLSGIPDPVVDARTLNDVTSIFGCNETICRIGIGNSMVWERHPSAGPSKLLLVSDGNAVPNPAVPKFFHAGYLFKPEPSSSTIADASDNVNLPRPARGEEIEQLRDLLQRILT